MFSLTSAGDRDIFVSKLDAGGNFVWAKRMGGTGNDWGGGIALDASGNLYATGGFHGTVDFDPGVGTFNLISAGNSDIFVINLDSAGNLVWAKAMGGTDGAWGSDIALDASGAVYTAGSFGGTVDFDPGAGTTNLTSAGGGVDIETDIFISKLDVSGSFQWAKRMGGTNIDRGNGIAVEASGNVYTTGSFWETVDFDPGPGTVDLTSAGNADIFVSKLARTEYLGVAWVDFGFVGGETGSEDNPFNTLAEGLIALVEPGTVKIKGNTGDSVSDETMTIDQDVTIEAVIGTVSIGDPGARSATHDAPKGGFITRPRAK